MATVEQHFSGFNTNSKESDRGISHRMETPQFDDEVAGAGYNTDRYSNAALMILADKSSDLLTVDEINNVSPTTITEVQGVFTAEVES